MNKDYEERKEAAREKARCIELYLEIVDASENELDELHGELERLAKKNGMVEEFKQNGWL